MGSRLLFAAAATLLIVLPASAAGPRLLQGFASNAGPYNENSLLGVPDEVNTGESFGSGQKVNVCKFPLGSVNNWNSKPEIQYLPVTAQLILETSGRGSFIAPAVGFLHFGPSCYLYDHVCNFNYQEPCNLRGDCQTNNTCFCTNGYKSCVPSDGTIISASAGCETYVYGDPNNCGTCGNVCSLGAVCIMGVCNSTNTPSPPPPPPLTNTPPSPSSGGSTSPNGSPSPNGFSPSSSGSPSTAGSPGFSPSPSRSPGVATSPSGPGTSPGTSYTPSPSGPGLQPTTPGSASTTLTGSSAGNNGGTGTGNPTLDPTTPSSNSGATSAGAGPSTSTATGTPSTGLTGSGNTNTGTGTPSTGLTTSGSTITGPSSTGSVPSGNNVPATGSSTTGEAPGSSNSPDTGNILGSTPASSTVGTAAIGSTMDGGVVVPGSTAAQAARKAARKAADAAATAGRRLLDLAQHL